MYRVPVSMVEPSTPPSTYANNDLGDVFKFLRYLVGKVNGTCDVV